MNPSPSIISPASPPLAAFRRTQITWLAYLLLSLYAFMAAMFGPLLPSLRAELGMSYGLGGLHLSALAVGILLAGLGSGRLVRRWGRGGVLRLGGGGVMAGALLLILGRAPPWTLAGVLLIGLSGALVQILVQAILASQHGEQRTVALMEANIGAGLSAMLAPLCVGGFQRLGLGWRPAILLGVGLLLGLALLIPRRAIPDAPSAPDRSAPGAPRRGLPEAFWAFWAVVFLAVAVEWILMVWSPDFLEKAAGFSRPAAAALMSLFYLAYVMGRVWGSRLSRRRPASTILRLAFAITLLGFPIFWLAPAPALTLAGLAVCGFGTANLFPLAMAAAVGAAPGQPDAASARVSLALGSSVLVTPFTLGALADQIGIQGAFLLLPPLALLAVAATFLPIRLPRRQIRV